MSIEILEPFILGGIASCVSEALTFPIDVTKTRIQIENQKKLKYKGVLNCFRVIVREEGALALYGGYLDLHLFSFKSVSVNYITMGLILD